MAGVFREGSQTTVMTQPVINDSHVCREYGHTAKELRSAKIRLISDLQTFNSGATRSHWVEE
jgi:hypothetical protein